MEGCTSKNFERFLMEGWEAVFEINGVNFFYERSGNEDGFHLDLYKQDIQILNKDIDSMDECLDTVLSTEVFEGRQLRDCYDIMIVTDLIE